MVIPGMKLEKRNDFWKLSELSSTEVILDWVESCGQCLYSFYFENCWTNFAFYSLIFQTLQGIFWVKNINIFHTNLWEK